MCGYGMDYPMGNLWALHHAHASFMPTLMTTTCSGRAEMGIILNDIRHMTEKVNIIYIIRHYRRPQGVVV